LASFSRLLSFLKDENTNVLSGPEKLEVGYARVYIPAPITRHSYIIAGQHLYLSDYAVTAG
jgi:hypothetical protein